MWLLIDEIGIVGLVLAIAAMFGGAAAQASIGMGLNLFTVGILALINPVFVPAPILVHSFVLSVIASVRLRQDINLSEVYLSILGLIIGTLLAASVLALVSLDHLPRVFGLIIVVGVAITALGVHLPLTKSTIVSASAAAGIMGTIAGVHGPPIALVYQREKPARIRAALLPFLQLPTHIRGWPLRLLANSAGGRCMRAFFYCRASALGLFAHVLIRAFSPAMCARPF